MVIKVFSSRAYLTLAAFGLRTNSKPQANVTRLSGCMLPTARFWLMYAISVELFESISRCTLALDETSRILRAIHCQRLALRICRQTSLTNPTNDQ
jgi:hypothetical protein